MMQHVAQLTVNPAEETIQVGPTRVHFLVTGAESNGSVASFELTIPGGAALAGPAHSHDAYEETIYGLTGVSTWTVDGQRIEVAPGQALCIPRGAVHSFANHGDVDAKTLATLTPATIGPDFFRESAAVIAAAHGEPSDRAKMGEIMRRHGLTPAPPPSARGRMAHAMPASFISLWSCDTRRGRVDSARLQRTIAPIAERGQESHGPRQSYPLRRQRVESAAHVLHGLE